MKNTKPTLSIRGLSVPPSPIRQLAPLAEAAKQQSTKVFHINIGDPDFFLSDTIQQTLKEKGKSTKKMPYPAFRGQPQLLDAWINYYQDIHITHTFVREDMIITAGASNAMTLIIGTITDPGDEILVFEPFYAPYFIYASFLGIKLVPVALDPKTGYHLPTKEEIVKRITPKTKAICLTNPNNPTGTVFTKEEIKLVLAIAKEKNLFVIGDETYRGLVFDNKDNYSLFHLVDQADVERIIIADSISKRLNMCGARIGVVVSKNREVVDAAFRFIQGMPFAAYLEQEISFPMVADSLDYLAWLTKEYQKRRDAFITTFEKEMKLKVHQPEGAFYTMIQLPIKDTNKFARWLLTDFTDKKETVMVSPGAGFYATTGKGFNEIRVAYILEEEELKRAAELLALAVKKYNE